jgi:magnesium-transporting ATPase (P-type)
MITAAHIGVGIKGRCDDCDTIVIIIIIIIMVIITIIIISTSWSSLLLSSSSSSSLSYTGEEGVQAVNASDYSIAQFRYLSILLLKHGRYNYIRMSNLICYIFYKNVLCSLTLFWFNFRCAFSAQKPYTEAAIQLFNLFYTSVPIVLYSAMDKDVSVHNALSFPKLYTPGIKGYSFNVSIIMILMMMMTIVLFISRAVLS